MVTPLRRLHHVQLSCAPGGEDAARAFWVGAMGLVEVPKPPGSGAARRGLVPGGPPLGATGPDDEVLEVHVGVEDPLTPATRAHPALLVQDGTALDALADRLRAGGWRVVPDALLPGYRRFYTADPAGNRIEVLAPDGPAPESATPRGDTLSRGSVGPARTVGRTGPAWGNR